MLNTTSSRPRNSTAHRCPTNVPNPRLQVTSLSLSVSEQVGEQLVHNDGHDQDDPRRNETPEGLHAGEGEAVGHDADDEHPDQGGHDPSLASVQARPPD